MRAFALAAMIGVGLSVGGVAEARPWTDPAGRLSIDVPAGWVVDSRQTEGVSYVIAGNANNECQFVATPNTNSTGASMDAIRRTILNDAQFTDVIWLGLVNGVASVFPNNSAVFVSRSRDEAGAWPVQRAELQSPRRLVHAGLQLRPGMDLLGLCMTYDGADPTAIYDNVLRTMGHPNDAQFQAQGETQAAERAAAAAAAAATAAAAPPPPPANERRRRNN